MGTDPLWTIPSAEPFPLDVFPIPARDLAESVARSVGCPVDFPAVATLAAASGLIGRSASLLVKPWPFRVGKLISRPRGEALVRQVTRAGLPWHP